MQSLGLLPLVALLLLASPAWAATYCVDAAATDADNTCCTSSDSCATCDSGDACDTIQEYISSNADGDTAIIAPGIYSDEITIRKSSENNNTLTCSGAGTTETSSTRCFLEGWNEIPSASWVAADCTGTNDCWFNASAVGIVTSDGNWHDNWLWVDGVPGTMGGFIATWVDCNVANPTTTGTPCTEDETAVDENWEFFYKQSATASVRGVYLKTDGTNPANHRIFEIAGGGDGFDIIADGVTINGPWVVQGFQGNGIQCFDCDTLSVRGTAAAPIILNFNGRRECDSTGCSGPNLDIFGTCATADTDYSSGGDYDWIESRYAGRAGFRIFAGAKNQTISNTTVLKSELHPPWDILGSCGGSNVVTSGNTIEDGTATQSLGCIQDSGGKDDIWRRLKCTDPRDGNGGLMINAGPQNGNRTENILIDSVHVDGGSSGSGSMVSVKALNGGTITNSTIIGGGSSIDCLVAKEDGTPTAVSDFTFSNNIISGTFATRILTIGRDDGDTSAAGVTFTNNLYDTSTTFAAQVIDDGGCSGTCTYNTFAAWQSGQSQDATSLNAAALLTDGVPSARSPAIGNSTTATAFDVLNGDRPRGNGSDLGAYEVWTGNFGQRSRIP